MNESKKSLPRRISARRNVGLAVTIEMKRKRTRRYRENMSRITRVVAVMSKVDRLQRAKATPACPDLGSTLPSLYFLSRRSVLRLLWIRDLWHQAKQQRCSMKSTWRAYQPLPKVQNSERSLFYSATRLILLVTTTEGMPCHGRSPCEPPFRENLRGYVNDR